MKAQVPHDKLLVTLIGLKKVHAHDNIHVCLFVCLFVFFIIPLITDDCCPFPKLWRKKHVDGIILFSCLFSLDLFPSYFLQQRSYRLRI